MTHETTKEALRVKYQVAICVALRRGGGLTRDALRKLFDEPEQGAVLFVLDEMAGRGAVKLDGDAYDGGIYTAPVPRRPRASLAARPRSEDGEDRLVGGSGHRGGRGHE